MHVWHASLCPPRWWRSSVRSRDSWRCVCAENTARSRLHCHCFVQSPVNHPKTSACLVVLFLCGPRRGPATLFIDVLLWRLASGCGAISRATSVPKRLFNDSPRCRPRVAFCTMPRPVRRLTLPSARPADFSKGMAVLNSPLKMLPMPKLRW